MGNGIKTIRNNDCEIQLELKEKILSKTSKRTPEDISPSMRDRDDVFDQGTFMNSGRLNGSIGEAAPSMLSKIVSSRSKNIRDTPVDNNSGLGSVRRKSSIRSNLSRYHQVTYQQITFDRKQRSLSIAPTMVLQPMFIENLRMLQKNGGDAKSVTGRSQTGEQKRRSNSIHSFQHSF